ncbi:unnamed protein product [Lactuca saligna]|uniref:DUF7804 domain-containing protein n=1 Tax=Lactuca saligna TaxID=75948 RepID=A0AA36DWK7_LACSI|nr:unnamed protein product [Lactuca saligna]
MVCLGIRYGLSKSTAAFFNDRRDPISGFKRLHSPSIPKVAVKNNVQRISAVAAVVSDRRVSNQVSFSIDADLMLANRFVNDDNEFDNRATEISSVPDKFEEWIEGSVTEIVKNITQAPLLLQIYANGEVKTKKAVKAESWLDVITESSSPDGIILVEELSENRDHISEREFNEKDGTRAFGVLIQGEELLGKCILAVE